MRGQKVELNTFKTELIASQMSSDNKEGANKGGDGGKTATEAKREGTVITEEAMAKLMGMADQMPSMMSAMAKLNRQQAMEGLPTGARNEREHRKITALQFVFAACGYPKGFA